ncbi:cytochrome b [Methylocystis rosea]|uniref:cytochrome b n=1 Tax=Methylocystis rosea TaxID=173366 RepID=UPI000364F14B|nr:cytochrome b [Methylocystis rosea]
MQWRNSPRAYGAAVQIVHWFSVLLVGVAWVLGTVGEDLPNGSACNLGELIHVSAGELIAILLIVRVGWRLINAPPSPELTPLGRLGDLATKIVHIALYVLLAAVVAVGVATQFADGDALSVLGVFDIASPWTKNKPFAHDMKEIHETLANGLIILATIHAGAALVHHFVFRDRTLRRMLPGVSEPR